jgi:hypothetical protein
MVSEGIVSIRRGRDTEKPPPACQVRMRSQEKGGSISRSIRHAILLSRLQTIQPWRKLPPAPPERVRGFVRVSFHNAITLHPFFENVNRVSRLFLDFL